MGDCHPLPLFVAELESPTSAVCGWAFPDCPYLIYHTSHISYILVIGQT